MKNKEKPGILMILFYSIFAVIHYVSQILKITIVAGLILFFGCFIAVLINMSVYR